MDNRVVYGCISLYNCQHWCSKNCLVSRTGHFRAKEEKANCFFQSYCRAITLQTKCNFGNPEIMINGSILNCCNMM